jgi:beta-glucosidase
MSRTTNPLLPLLPAGLAVALVLLPGGRLRAGDAGAPNPVEARVEGLLRQMTLEEKLGQLQQLDGSADGRIKPEQLALAMKGLLGSTLNVRGAANVNEIQRAAVDRSRLKIPILAGYDVIHGYRTIFPIPLGEAASFDPALAETTARIAAAEATAVGLKWTFAPMVDIARDPRWGRIAEGAGEDPYLGSAFARARVRGFRGGGGGDPERVIACAKHWVGYGAAEAGREYNTTDLSERALREVYFPPFRAALEAGVGTFMSAFNDLDGLPATANPFTLTRVLRGEWGFDGFVVSDYTAVPELIQHGVARDEPEAAQRALTAGVDMEMVSRLYATRLPALVRAGVVPMATLDEAVRRVLRIKMRAGLFERPYAEEGREAAVLLNPAHRETARTAAARSIVLLRNEGGVLPLRKDLRSIALIGPLADDPREPLGSWSGDGRKEDTVTVVAGVKAKLGPEVRLAYAKGCDVEGGSPAQRAEAVARAREAEAVVLVVGESAAMSGEAGSRSSIDLPGPQLGLVQEVLKAGKPTVVVLMNGRPLTIPWIAENAAAILETWQGGTEAGHAIADVLFGDANPGGKLPVTFPRSVGQIPLYYNHKNTGRPVGPQRWSSKYLDIPVSPLYPFGFGLSYTRFALHNLRVSAASVPPGGEVTVSVDVENVGPRAGDEVVQLYVSHEAASVTRPVKQLRGFERLTLAAGETRPVRFRLGPADLGLLDGQFRLVVEPGEIRVAVGTSSEGGLEGRFRVVGD